MLRRVEICIFFPYHSTILCDSESQTSRSFDSVYFFYLDETGNTGTDLSAPDQPIHWLCALAIPATSLLTLDAAIRRVLRDVFDARLHVPDFELHGSDILQGRGHCAGLTPSHRVALYDAVLSLLRTHGVTVFAYGVDKARLAGVILPIGVSRHPHLVAFAALTQRIDTWLGHIVGHGLDSRLGLLVADEHRETRTAAVQSLARWQYVTKSDGSRDIASTTPPSSYDSIVIRHLVDTVHYVPSHESRLIQLADCVAYLTGRVARVRRGTDTPPTKTALAVVTLWDRHIAPCLVSSVIGPEDEDTGTTPMAGAKTRSGRR